jgi:hypothetical protein
MPETLPRTGIEVPLADRSDLVKPVDVLRALGAFFDANVLIVAQGLLSARPAAGKAGRFYRALDDPSSPIVYYDDGTQWTQIGATAPVDGVAATPSLRTLGSSPTQAAAGNHTHSADAILGAGGDNYILTLMGAL